MISFKRMVPVLAVAVASACTVTAFIGGCGGSDEDDTFQSVANVGEILGRSFNGSVPIDAGRIATVLVQTASGGGTASGSFTLNTRSRSVPGSGRAVVASGTATGTVDTRTGEFRISGTYNDGGAKPFSITGILPSSANVGDFTLTLGGSSFTGRLTAAGTSITPSPSSSPSVSPSPSASASPSASPSVSPSPSPSVSPSPSPSPSGSPGSSLSARFYPLRTGDVYTYTFTTSGTALDVTRRTGSLTTFKGNSAFRIEDVEANGKATSYSYANITPGGYTVYGSEDLTEEGAVDSTSEFVPPFTLPESVLNGNAGSFSYRSTVVNSDGTTAEFTYEGTATPMGRETVTVPAGTFNALKVRVQSTILVTSNGQAFRTTSDDMEYLVEDVGMVRSESTSTSQFGTTTSTEVLKSATVGGKTFP